MDNIKLNSPLWSYTEEIKRVDVPGIPSHTLS